MNLQRHLEKNHQRMIGLFEGRDAAGKGGIIRRVTRFMHEVELMDAARIRQGKFTH